MRRSTWLGVALGLVMGGGTARADVWDTQTDNDNSVTTDNDLVHGTAQRHDLGALPGPAADQDWYLVGQRGRSSYEVIVDGASGDILGTLPLRFERIAADGTTVLQASVPIGGGYSRSLRWENSTAQSPTEYVRIISGVCTTDCGADDVYDIRFRETTIAVPRFNNAGGQITVLIIQNAGDVNASGNIYFRNTGATVLATSPFSVVGGGALVLNTAGVAGAAGVSGTMTISHDARFGQLAVKSVALEPATGFSFDTPGLYKLY